MKKELFCSILILFSSIVSAQDTIFVKNGEKIPAVIVSKDNNEVKYKKYGQREPAAVYSVFLTDIKSIHYSDGIIADYTSVAIAGGNKRPVDYAGKMGVGKLSLGTAYMNFSGSSGELNDFWTLNPGMNNSTPVIFNPVLYPLELRINFVLGNARRNWIGTGLELIFTPSDAIHAKSTDGKDELSLHGWYYNIPLYYGHSINHKKNLVFILEPSLNLAFISGNIKMSGTDYKLVSNLGVGMHIGAGIDWIITKRLHASLRAGERFLKVKESHESDASSTGYSSFYTISKTDGDLLTIQLNGPYVSAGLSWSMYFKMKGITLE